MRKLFLLFCLTISFFLQPLFAQVALPLKGPFGETIIGNGMITSFDVTKDDRYLVIGTSLGVMIHDANTFELINTFQKHSSIAKVMLTEDDKHVLSVSMDGSIYLWEIETKHVTYSSTHYKNKHLDVTISPDMNFIAVAVEPSQFSSKSEQGIHIWEVKSNTKKFVVLYRKWNLGDRELFHLDTMIRFFPTSDRLLICGEVNDNTLARVFDLNQNKILTIPKMSHKGDYVYSGIFIEKANALILCHADSGVRLQGYRNGKKTTQYYNAHSVWDLNTLKHKSTIPFSPEYGKTIAIQTLDNSRFILAQKLTNNLVSDLKYFVIKQSLSSLGIKEIYDPVEYVAHKRVYSLSSRISAVHFIPEVANDRFVYFSDQNKIIKWDIDNAEIDSEFTPYEHLFGFHAALLDRDKKIVTVGTNLFRSTSVINSNPSQTITSSIAYSWDILARKIIQTFVGHKNPICAMDLSLDETLLATASLDNTVKIWDVKTGKENRSLSFSAPIHDVTFFPNGENIITSSDEAPAIWDSDTGELKTKLDGNYKHDSIVYKTIIEPDLDMLITVASDELKIWKYDTSVKPYVMTEHIHTMNGKRFEFEHASISKDGTLIATIDLNGVVSIWTIQSGELVTKLVSETVSNRSRKALFSKVQVKFSPDKTKLIVGGLNGSIDIWNIADWKLFKSFHFDTFGQNPEMGISHIEFLDNLTQFLTVTGTKRLTSDSQIRIWNLY